MNLRILFLTLAILAALTPAPVRAATGLSAYVDPFLGTSNTPDGSDVIDDFPGADVPFGMLQWSPDTPSGNAGGGYEYNDKAITGFSLTHLSGPGCGVFGDFRILPVSGAVSDPAHAQQPFSHANESASPGWYRVAIGSAPIQTQISVAPRVGVAQFDFPASAAANVLFNVASDQAGVRNAGFRVSASNEVEGFADTGGFCGMPDRYSVYFVAQFDRPIASYGTWQGAQITPNAASVQGANAGGWVSFDPAKSQTVRMRVAISFVDTAGARANLRLDNHGFAIARVRSEASAAWDRLLARIAVTGGTAAEQREFYTAFYHAMLHPNLFDDADGRYRGFDGRVHRVRAGHHEYANFSDWDIYRTLVPLQALLVPRESSDMMQSLVDAAQQDVYLPRWALANGATSVMGGDSVDPVISGAYAFGARDFDVAGALAAMVKGATDSTSVADGWYIERPELAEYLRYGYIVNTHTTSVSPVPNGASETLEYALDDFSIAQFARAIKDRPVYTAFMKRASNWANLFDTASGLIAPRDASGAFMQTAITSNGQSGFQEGNAAQYTWMVPQDLAGLIRGMGGAAAARQKLDTFFTQINAGQDKPYAWLGNEPTLGSPWVYLSAGAPWRAQQIVRQSITTMFADSPHGIPGNDDLGTMSAWWMWSAMGLYPQNPSVRVLDIGSPLFASVAIHPESGPDIVIRAPQASDATPYVQALRVNGKQTTHTWVALPMRGTLALDFALGASPDTMWGTAENDAPPSFALQPVVFPPSTRMTLKTQTAQLDLTTGQAGHFTLTFDNTGGAAPETVRWTSGSASGTEVVPADEVHTADVAVAPSETSALREIPVRAQTSTGAILAMQYPVAVRDTQHPLRLAYIANRFDDTLTPFDPATGAVGVAFAAGKEPRDEALSPDGKYVYVADRGGRSLAVIDAATHNVRFVKVGNAPNGTAVSPDGKTVWVANYDDSAVQPVDTATLRAGKPIAVGLNPRYIAISPDGRTLYVTNQNGNTVTPIALPSGSRETDIPVGAHPSGIAITPDGTMAYVANSGTNDITPIDLRAGKALALIRAGFDASMIAISPDGKTAIVSNFATTTVTLLDLATRAVRNVTVGGAPYGIAFSADSRKAWVVLRRDSAIVLVDVASGRAGTPIGTGSTSPYSIVLPR